MSEESKVQLEKANIIIEEFMRCKEKVDCADVRASLITKREVGVDEEFVVRIDLVNAGMNSALVVRLEDIVPSDFKVVNLPPDTRMQNCAIEMNAKEIGPFQVEPVRLTLHAQRVGAFTLNPRVIYNDHVGETKTRELPPITITVRPTIHAKIGDETVSVPILPDRLPVGFKDLDVLLYGGIPENYAVVLTSSPSDERESIAQRFLEAGTKAGQPTFCLTTEAGMAKNLAEDYKASFFLFVCNPRAEVPTHENSNIFRFKGVENLTEIDIALIKAFRSMGTSYTGPKRAYIDIVSDVLLQHRALTARKWLTALVADLKAKGFTTLAVVNPDMHSQEDVQAILSLFDGEIRISEKETARTTQKVLRVRKLHRQRYLENELVLNKEALGQ